MLQLQIYKKIIGCKYFVGVSALWFSVKLETVQTNIVKKEFGLTYKYLNMFIIALFLEEQYWKTSDLYCKLDFFLDIYQIKNVKLVY